MPQDIVVGEDAEKVADFVATYSGGKTPVVPADEPPAGTQPEANP